MKTLVYSFVCLSIGLLALLAKSDVAQVWFAASLIINALGD